MTDAKNVLIVGGSRGIGLALARQYRAAGARVTATARSDAGLATLRGLGARALALDVAQAESCSRLAWQIDGEAFDTVVFCAGVFGPSARGLSPPTQADFDAVMHTNVLGAMRVVAQLTEALAPGARLAVLSSLMGSMGERHSGHAWLYRASKAALNSVLKDVSLQLDGRAICVALHPGWVKTDMGGASAVLEAADSAAQLCALLAQLGPQHNGQFLSHDGREIAW